MLCKACGQDRYPIDVMGADMRMRQVCANSECGAVMGLPLVTMMPQQPKAVGLAGGTLKTAAAEPDIITMATERLESIESELEKLDALQDEARGLRRLIKAYYGRKKP